MLPGAQHTVVEAWDYCKGASKQTINLTVKATTAPKVALSANPASITAGASSTLTVTASNATQVKVTGSDGSSYTLPVAGGTQTVSPAATTTYTATRPPARSGTVTAAATVTVTRCQNAYRCHHCQSALDCLRQQLATLTVTATNATGVTISGSDGSSYSLGATGGMQSVSPDCDHHLHGYCNRNRW